MPETYFGTWGMGALGPWGSTTWVADVQPGGVWHFWVDNTSIGYDKTWVVVDTVIAERQANSHRVGVTVRNARGTQAGFALRWTAVYP